MPSPQFILCTVYVVNFLSRWLFRVLSPQFILCTVYVVNFRSRWLFRVLSPQFILCTVYVVNFGTRWLFRVLSPQFILCTVYVVNFQTRWLFRGSFTSIYFMYCLCSKFSNPVHVSPLWNFSVIGDCKRQKLVQTCKIL